MSIVDIKVEGISGVNNICTVYPNSLLAVQEPIPDPTPEPTPEPTPTPIEPEDPVENQPESDLEKLISALIEFIKKLLNIFS